MGWFWVDGAHPAAPRPLAGDPQRDRKLAALAWFIVPFTGLIGPLVLWLIARTDRGLPATRRNSLAALWAASIFFVAWAIYIIPKVFDQEQSRAEFDSTFIRALIVWAVIAVAAAVLGLLAFRRSTDSTTRATGFVPPAP